METTAHALDAGRPRERLLACRCCGMVSRVVALAPHQVARCPRCRAGLPRPVHRGGASRVSARVTAVSLAALALFPSAVTLPIMRIEEMGHSSEASIWSGALALLRGGDLFVGSVVFLCSIAFPLLKLGGLIAITAGRRGLERGARRLSWRIVDLTGRWGMLDVLLVAVVVAWVKVGDLVDIQPGPAALSFTLVVLLSLVATALFDPHALWDEIPIQTEDACASER
ncbi:MAG: paraquat-inducible protein A [Planctomycetota bacterium]|nr:paraquat-inducible protein A [Planctomycetota bacterium]